MKEIHFRFRTQSEIAPCVAAGLDVNYYYYIPPDHFIGYGKIKLHTDVEESLYKLLMIDNTMFIDMIIDKNNT